MYIKNMGPRGQISLECGEDKRSLCFKFTVEASSELGKSWLKVYCSLDEKLLFEYNNANKAELVGSIGEGNSTKVWEDVTQTVKEMGQEFRKRLLHIRPKTNNTKDHPELQVNMCCQRELEQNTGASLLFNLNKQNLVLFDPNSMTWTELHPEARGVKTILENDKELEKDLKKFSMGDCSHWLNEFLKHWTEISRQTVKTLDAVQMSPKSWNMNAIITVVFTIVILILIGVFIGVVIFWNHIVSYIRRTLRGQHTPSAVGEPHPEETICMNVMCPMEGDSPCCSSASSVI
ncbi:retinoic acid early transcript 1E-like [Microtus oregoni]|uniref:retinoic acid early transcript 1E-like n=1 Tax=Microtus oregoni TaxID=111838 RepID=UPI001BB1F790|nr:retinoic acid early transcript 1E-like [Microtus oregoni]